MENNEDLILLKSLPRNEQKTIASLLVRKNLNKHTTEDGVAFSATEFIEYTASKEQNKKRVVQIKLNPFSSNNYVYKQYDKLPPRHKSYVSKHTTEWYIDENGVRYFDLREIVKPFAQQLAARIRTKSDVLEKIIYDGLKQKYIEQYEKQKKYWAKRNRQW